MVRWVVGLLVAAAVSTPVIAQGDAPFAAPQAPAPRVLIDATFLVPPGGTGPQCVELEPGIVAVEVQRVGDYGSRTAERVAFNLSAFVVATPPISDLNVTDALRTLTVTVQGGAHCFSWEHGRQWTNRAESAQYGQFIRLRLTNTPASH